MPKRPGQHQLEDTSRSKLTLLFPREWVLRDKDKDYGIDVEVEVFDLEGYSTGLMFFVQLKATESDNMATIRNLDFSIDRLDYYETLDLPVLICRYSYSEDLFYAKWSSEIDTFNCKKGAKTVRLKFNENDVLKTENQDNLLAHVTKLRSIRRNLVRFPVSVFLQSRKTYLRSIPRALFLTKVKAELSKFSEYITIINNVDDAYIVADLTDEKLEMDFSKLVNLTINQKDEVDSSRFEEIAKNILFGLGVCLGRINLDNLAMKIFLLNEVKARVIEKQKLIINLIPSLIKTDHMSEVVDLLLKASDQRKDNLVEAILQLTILSHPAMSKNKDASNAYKTVLEHCLNKYTALGSDDQIGIAHYNLANSLANNNLKKEALHHYAQARKHNPIYSERFYFYKEVASILFNVGKFRFASNFYNRAIGLTNGRLAEEIEPLLADALMYSGEYSKALELFKKYFSNSNRAEPEWILKYTCLEAIVENLDILNQTRKPKSAWDLAASAIDDEKVLGQAVRLDCLCGFAWFNLGILHSGSGRYESAAFCFSMCALVQNRDIEAWVNATLCCFNKEVPIFLLSLVYQVAHLYNGENYISELYQQVEAQLSGEALSNMHNLLEALQKEIDEQEIATQIIPRSPNENALLRDFLASIE
jgi:tetratricopeptide (TPR) repeat protein